MYLDGQVTTTCFSFSGFPFPVYFRGFKYFGYKIICWGAFPVLLYPLSRIPNHFILLRAFFILKVLVPVRDRTHSYENIQIGRAGGGGGGVVRSYAQLSRGVCTFSQLDWENIFLRATLENLSIRQQERTLICQCCKSPPSYLTLLYFFLVLGLVQVTLSYVQCTYCMFSQWACCEYYWPYQLNNVQSFFYFISKLWALFEQPVINNKGHV